jgi:hypothetical protein
MRNLINDVQVPLFPQTIQAIHLFAEPQDHKTVEFMADAIAHGSPVALVEFNGVGPYLIDSFQVEPISLPGSFSAFAVLQILKVNPDKEAGYYQGKNEDKMLLGHFRNMAF